MAVYEHDESFVTRAPRIEIRRSAAVRWAPGESFTRPPRGRGIDAGFVQGASDPLCVPTAVKTISGRKSNDSFIVHS
jgi:hypothetical protein